MEYNKVLLTGDAQQSSAEKIESAMDDSAVRRFFSSVLQHIDNPALSTAVRLNMLRSAEEQLNKYGLLFVTDVISIML